MRLLDTSTLEFKDFNTVPEGQYAILSHRWTDEEVSHKEFRKKADEVKHRAGYRKIIEFCHFALQRGYAWAWIDTCCIDKRSSAELSEAINSMCMWYRMSGECHVLLHDYQGRLENCAWFTRSGRSRSYSLQSSPFSARRSGRSLVTSIRIRPLAAQVEDQAAHRMADP